MRSSDRQRSARPRPSSLHLRTMILPSLAALATAFAFQISALKAACTDFQDTDFQCASDCDIFQIVDVPSFAACCAACSANATCWAAAYNVEKTCYFKGRGAFPRRRSGTMGCSCKGEDPATPPTPPNLCAASATAGYSASVIARSVGPQAGSSLISKAGGTSDLEFNCEESALLSDAC